MAKYVSNIRLSTQADLKVYEWQQHRNIKMTKQEAINDLIEHANIAKMMKVK